MAGVKLEQVLCLLREEVDFKLIWEIKIVSLIIIFSTNINFCPVISFFFILIISSSLFFYIHKMWIYHVCLNSGCLLLSALQYCKSVSSVLNRVVQKFWLVFFTYLNHSVCNCLCNVCTQSLYLLQTFCELLSLLAPIFQLYKNLAPRDLIIS